MSSAGGFFSPHSDPERLRMQIREAERTTGCQEYETDVAKVIAAALSQYNNRDADGIRRILDKILADLGNEIDGSIEMIFGGSVAKHTYVDGLSDLDALVIVPSSAADDLSPADLRATFAEILIARFGRDAVREGNLAVTLTLNDSVLQLLPAVREASGLKIASPDASEWARINPQTFMEALTKANEVHSGKLVPTIKLVKGIIGGQPEQRRTTGYHTESLALKVFEGYDGDRTPKAMLQYFFEHAGAFVLKPIGDITGQSTHVDEYLGEPDSIPRRVIADAFDRIARVMKNADGAQSIERWQQLLTVDPNDAI